MGIFGRFCGNDVEKEALELFGDRATGSAPDSPVIEFTYRGDFCCGARKEGFVGTIDFVARNALLNDFKAEIVGQSDNRIASDTVEAACQIRSIEFPVFDDEHTFTGTFGNKAFRVE